MQLIINMNALYVALWAYNVTAYM